MGLRHEACNEKIMQCARTLRDLRPAAMWVAWRPGGVELEVAMMVFMAALGVLEQDLGPGN